MKKSERLTYMTQGDATRSSHYCVGPGVNKDIVVQRLGRYEDSGLSPDEINKLTHETKKLVFDVMTRYPHILAKVSINEKEPVYVLMTLDMNTGPKEEYVSRDFTEVVKYAKSKGLRI